MTDPELHIDDKETVLRFTVKEGGVALDLSTSTLRQLILQKRNKEIIIADMSFFTDGVDGKLEYITSGSDIDNKGTWKGQVYLEFGTGHWHTSTADIEVGANLA